MKIDHIFAVVFAMAIMISSYGFSQGHSQLMVENVNMLKAAVRMGGGAFEGKLGVGIMPATRTANSYEILYEKKNNYTQAQRSALLTADTKYNTGYDEFMKKWNDVPFSSKDQYEQLSKKRQDEHDVIFKEYTAEVEAIKKWPNGQNPNAGKNDEPDLPAAAAEPIGKLVINTDSELLRKMRQQILNEPGYTDAQRKAFLTAMDNFEQKLIALDKKWDGTPYFTEDEYHQIKAKYDAEFAESKKQLIDEINRIEQAGNLPAGQGDSPDTELVPGSQNRFNINIRLVDGFRKVRSTVINSTDTSKAQRKAMVDVINDAIKKVEELIQKWNDTPYSSKEQLAEIQAKFDAERDAIVKQLSEKLAEISNWPKGKNPNTRMPGLPDTRPLSPAKEAVKQKLEGRQDAFKGNPHDRLEKIPGIHLSDKQKTSITKLRTQRQKAVSRIVSVNFRSKWSTRQYRNLFYMLKKTIIRYNNLIEDLLDPEQINILRDYEEEANDIVQIGDITSPEQILEDITPEDIYDEDGQDAASDDEYEDIRLTHYNFYLFEECCEFLKLTDLQMMELAGIAAEADAYVENIDELVKQKVEFGDDGKALDSGRMAFFEIQIKTFEKFASFQRRIEKLIPSGSKERFGAFSLFLWNVYEYPGPNRCSFGVLELTQEQKSKIETCLLLSSWEMQSNSETHLEEREVCSTLLRNSLTEQQQETWDNLISEYQDIHDTMLIYQQ